ncbi:hypothetical protein CLOM_g1194 [Closterium sp. NIES-68]|nr:hypothetical protein CLOM_g1194 [Closterium sp. NIES-68]
MAVMTSRAVTLRPSGASFGNVETFGKRWNNPFLGNKSKNILKPGESTRKIFGVKVRAGATRNRESARKSKSQQGEKGKQQQRQQEKKQPTNQALTPQQKVANLIRFSQDETLLFDPRSADPTCTNSSHNDSRDSSFSSRSDNNEASREPIRCIYAFPNEYTVGICSLGYQLVWAYLSSRPSVHVTRMFTDAHDPFPRNPNLLGFSFSWELDYVNVLNILEDLGIPVRSEERLESGSTCFVFGGGAVLSANPEPFADFFDVILMGDGEELLGSFMDAFEACVSGGGGEGGSDSSSSSSSGSSRRLEILSALAQVPGVYVPLLYRVEYHSPTGPIADVSLVQLPAGSMLPAAPPVVERQTYRGKQLATSTVVSPRMAWEGIYMVEVVRSCPEVCRFCLASYSSLPFRPAALEDHLIPAIERGLQVTNRIGLLGASVTQHPQFDALLSYLLQPHMKDIRLSIASVRTNTVTAKLAAALAQSGTRSLTIAVESGSERLRRVVNKKLDSADIIAAGVNAQEGGLSGLKLYGMVGLPSETDADVAATVGMMRELRKAAPRLKLTLGCSTFVPKAHTPFQWQPVQPAAEGRLRLLEKEMRKEGVEFRPESYKWSVWQAVLSRGDRRLSRLLQRAREFGGSQGSFGRAFKEMRGLVPPPEYYAFRQVDESEVLPWSHLSGSLPVAVLRQHAAEAATHFISTGSTDS